MIFWTELAQMFALQIYIDAVDILLTVFLVFFVVGH